MVAELAEGICFGGSETYNRTKGVGQLTVGGFLGCVKKEKGSKRWLSTQDKAAVIGSWNDKLMPSVIKLS